MLQFPWPVLQIIIYSDIPLEWISHSRNYKGNGLKLSAQRFLESLGGLERYLWLVDSIQGDH